MDEHLLRLRPLIARIALAAVAFAAAAACDGSTGAGAPGDSARVQDAGGPGSADPPQGGDDPWSNDEEPGGDLTPASFDALVGRTFRVTSIVEGGADRPVVAGTTIDVGFRTTPGQGPIVTAEAGCNHLAGTVAVTDGRLVVDSFGGTLMLCDPGPVAQDEWVGGLLQADPTAELQGGRLRLTTSAAVVELEEQPTGG